MRSIAPGSRPGLEQDLEAVADAEHRAAVRARTRATAVMIGREARDGAGAQVVAVREAAGQDDDVGALQARLLVPDELGVLAEHVLGRVVRVVIAVGAGKDDDGEFHDGFTLQLPALTGSRGCSGLRWTL